MCGSLEGRKADERHHLPELGKVLNRLLDRTSTGADLLRQLDLKYGIA